MSTANTQESTKIALHITTNPDGETAATIPVTWTLSPELIEQLREEEFVNPHILLILASKNAPPDGYGYYEPTKAYVAALNETPKKYVQFSRPGNNAVFAIVIDVRTNSDRDWLRRVIENPSSIDVSYDGEINWNYITLRHLEIQTMQVVSVPAELFAPEPPRWLRAVVNMCFRVKEIDQCHFRKRVLPSLLAQVPIQLYGIFARILTLVFALFMGMRGMRFRTLFALNPHDFAHGLENSYWFFDSEGEGRKSILPFVNPPAAFVYALGVAVLSIGGWIFSSVTHAGLWESVLVGVAIDILLASIITALWFFSGRERRRGLKRWVRNSLSRQPHQVDAEFYDKLLRSKPITHPAEPVKDDTVYLLFNAVKARVCRPFAQR